MKFEWNKLFIEEVRTTRYRYYPSNYILEVLVLIAVFLLANVMESIPLCFILMEKAFSWGIQQIDAGTELSSEEIISYIRNLMNSSDNTTIMLYCTVFATITILVYCRIVEGVRPSTLGFRDKKGWLHYLGGMVIGFAMFSMDISLNVLFGGIRSLGIQQFNPMNLLIVLIGFGLQGMSEEVICRGYMMTAILRKHKIWLAMLTNSVIFGLLHISNPGFSVLAMVNITLFGVFMSMYMLRTGNIWGVCAIHSIWNYVQGNFYGLPVSGLDSGDSVFRFMLCENKDIINGGTFGLEGGIPTTIVLVVSIALLLLNSLPEKEKRAKAKEEPVKEQA